MTTLSIRIDEKMKKQANRALTDVGLDMSSAIKVFLSQVIKDKGLPFTPTSNPRLIRMRWDREAAEALKSGKRYSSAKELHDDILR